MESQKDAPKELRNVVDFLRSSKSGIKAHPGALNGSRVEYFKGKHAVKALLSPAYAKVKAVPPVKDEAEAAALLHRIIPYTFFLRVDRGGSTGGSGSPKVVQVNQMQLFAPEHYYAWFYVGSQWTTYLGGIAMVAVMLAGVMFPLWPASMRLGVWYLSMGVLGLLGLFFATAIVRLIFWIITIIVVSPGIWIFPNLFADVGFVDSFIPLWEWDIPPKKKAKKSKKVKGEKGEKGSAEDLAEGSASATKQSESDSSRPASRSARVEDADEEDD